jgi:hypothetical protein
MILGFSIPFRQGIASSCRRMENFSGMDIQTKSAFPMRRKSPFAEDFAVSCREFPRFMRRWSRFGAGSVSKLEPFRRR